MVVVYLIVEKIMLKKQLKIFVKNVMTKIVRNVNLPIQTYVKNVWITNIWKAIIAKIIVALILLKMMKICHALNVMIQIVTFVS